MKKVYQFLEQPSKILNDCQDIFLPDASDIDYVWS